MADNFPASPGSGRSVRTKQLAGVDTQIVQLDIGGESAEQLVVGAIPMSTLPVTTATLTTVAASLTSVSLLATNAARRNLIVVNDATGTLYLALAATAATTAYTVKLVPGAYWEIPLPVYAGVVSGIWDATGGVVRLTEMV